MKNQFITITLTMGCLTSIIMPLSASCSCGQLSEPEDRIFKCESIEPILPSDDNPYDIKYKYCFVLPGFRFNNINVDNTTASAKIHFNYDFPDGSGKIEADYELTGGIRKEDDSYSIQLFAETLTFAEAMVNPNKDFSLILSGDYELIDFEIKDEDRKINLLHDDYKLQIKTTFIDNASFYTKELDPSGGTQKYPIFELVNTDKSNFFPFPWIRALNIPRNDIYDYDNFSFDIQTNVENAIPILDGEERPFLNCWYGPVVCFDNSKAKVGETGYLKLTIKNKNGEKIFENDVSDSALNPWKIKIIG